MEDLLLHFYTFFIQFVKIHQTCSTVETGHKPKPKVNEFEGLKAKKLIKKKKQPISKLREHTISLSFSVFHGTFSNL